MFEWMFDKTYLMEEHLHFFSIFIADLHWRILKQNSRTKMYKYIINCNLFIKHSYY